jgi:hypothetical protein
MEADIIYKALAKVTLNIPFEYIFVQSFSGYRSMFRAPI